MEATRILKHLVDFSKGVCNISEESILQLGNEDDQMIELGLLTLFEEIEFNKRRLEKSNKEKEVLLQEIHHRVKNNLQIVGSLLALPKYYVDDEKSISLLRDCRMRVNTMSAIHEKLYNSTDMGNVDYQDYLNDLLTQLKIAHSFTDEDIQIHLDIPALKLSLNTAIPLGLIINEIFTNSMKYGANDEGKRELFLQITELKQDAFEMKIGDSGKGYPVEIFNSGTSTLGVQLIKDLTQQLNGSIEMIVDSAKKGAHYLIQFEVI